MNRKLRSKFNTRQYMLSEDFEVFYYSDLHFRSVGDHSHNYYEFYFFEEGNVEMDLSGKRYVLKPGDLIVVIPGTRHRALVRDGDVPYRRFVFWLSRAYCQALRRQSEDLVYVMKGADEKGYSVFHFGPVAFNTVRAKLVALLEEVNSKRFGRETRLSILINDLLLHLGRSIFEEETKASKSREQSSYEAAVSFIETHLDEDLSLDSLSEKLFQSKYYLSHLFTARTGMSLHRFILSKRLSAARESMLSGASAQQAAASAGFSDYSSFYRAFKKEYGTQPSKCR